MIINTGMRTDIPAFYSKWLRNRVKEGFVLVRNPYDPQQVTKYLLTPDVVDIMAFCSKNPAPLVPYLEEFDAFHPFWFVTITPYGPEIEPNVPPAEEVIETFRKVSDHVRPDSISWRYDPIFISDDYTVESHIEAFTRMAEMLRGYTRQVVISFIDLYEKTKHNFPQARRVRQEERIAIGEAFAKAGKQNGMTVRSCAEGTDLAAYGVDVSGCMTQQILEQSCGEFLHVPKSEAAARPECSCLLGRDIGAYNTCAHDCKYCYANYDKKLVRQNMRRHDPDSPFLIGHEMEGDRITPARQERFISDQMRFW